MLIDAIRVQRMDDYNDREVMVKDQGLIQVVRHDGMMTVKQ